MQGKTWEQFRSDPTINQSPLAAFGWAVGRSLRIIGFDSKLRGALIVLAVAVVLWLLF